jgi:DNA repair protein RadC
MKSNTRHLPEIRLAYKKSNVQAIHISSSQEAAKTFRSIFDEDTLPLFETFSVIFTNRANKTVGWMEVSKGGVSGTVVDVRLILKAALDCLASGILLCHNHPSGNPTPSSADIALTKKVKEASKLFDVTILDHIILVPVASSDLVNECEVATSKTYYSFADEGIL